MDKYYNLENASLSLKTVVAGFVLLISVSIAKYVGILASISSLKVQIHSVQTDIKALQHSINSLSHVQKNPQTISMEKPVSVADDTRWYCRPDGRGVPDTTHSQRRP